ncbi:MAG: redoxin domain-containing protein [Bryobacterales bacterium]|nr:redoxin domain-containing protein [Bryobacterales bacterium]
MIFSKFLRLVPAILMLALAGCSRSPQTSGNGSSSHTSRKTAADFSLRDVDGKTVKLSDFRGKVVLLNFWATWCSPCRVEIPWFIQFEQRYKDRGFAVIGIAMDDDGWNAVKPYIQAHHVNYRVVIGNDQVSAKYGGIDSLPTTLLVDRQGDIAATHIGLVSKASYENDIARLLNN